MKKVLALLVALCMVLALCPAMADATQELKDARSYIKTIYMGKPASTPEDYVLVGSVPGESETFLVEWTADNDSIVFTRNENGSVSVDVNENSPKELQYKLTATLKDAAGNEVSVSFDRFVPAALSLDVMTEEEIVAAAYSLEDGAALPALTALTGKIVAIPSAYNDQYDNVTVNIQVGDLADKPIQCYRLVGGSSLKVGDEITVLGTIKNYKDTIEFDKGCYTIDPAFAQSCRVAAFAYTLEDGASFNHESTVTGVISAIPSAYSEDYKNITVNIDVPGLGDYTIQCYRLTGEGAEALKEGDLITVTGVIKNYKGTIEFDKGCTFVPAAAENAAEDDEIAQLVENLLNDPDFLAKLEKAQSEEDIVNLLSQLFGGQAEEPAKDNTADQGQALAENGEGDLESLLGGLGQLFGGASNEGGEEDLEGLLGGLGQLFGGASNEGGEEDLDSLLSQLFGGMEGDAGAQNDGDDLESLLTGLFGLFGGN